VKHSNVFVLDQHSQDFYNVISLKEQSTCRHVAPLRHIILIQNQSTSLLLLFDDACSVEKQ